MLICYTLCTHFSLLVQVVDIVDILIGFSFCPNYGNFFFFFWGKKLAKFLNLYNIFIFPQNQLLATRDTVKYIDP